MSCEPWQWSHDDRTVTRAGAEHAEPHARGDRHSRAVDPEADRGTPSACATSDGAQSWEWALFASFTADAQNP